MNRNSGSTAIRRPQRYPAITDTTNWIYKLMDSGSERRCITKAWVFYADVGGRRGARPRTTRISFERTSFRRHLGGGWRTESMCDTVSRDKKPVARYLNWWFRRSRYGVCYSFRRVHDFRRSPRNYPYRCPRNARIRGAGYGVALVEASFMKNVHSGDGSIIQRVDTIRSRCGRRPSAGITTPRTSHERTDPPRA